MIQTTKKDQIPPRPALPQQMTAQSFGFSPPRLPEAQIAAFLQQTYELGGDLSPLAGERDQNLRLRTETGGDYVIKIASATESEEAIALQLAALAYIARVTPDLPVPRVVPARDGTLHQVINDADGTAHRARVLSHLPGLPLYNLGAPTADTLRATGELMGRLLQALSTFAHPVPDDFLAWDIMNGLMVTRTFGQQFMPEEIAAIGTPFLKRFAAQTLPRLRALPAQFIHNDVHLGNVLCDPNAPSTLTGCIDFGDMVYRPAVMELASCLADLATIDTDWSGAAQVLVEGYRSQVDLPGEDLPLLFDACLARALLCAQMARFRISQPGAGPEIEAEHLPDAIRAVQVINNTGCDRFCNALSATSLPSRDHAPNPSHALEARRRNVLAPNAAHFFDEIVHIVKGRGMWMWDETGTRYLDFYNNVASVGHCHPEVVAVLAQQAATLNVSTRYLHEAIVAFAESLTAKLPEHLDTCYFACSGTEANDLAVQVARKVTGQHGVLVGEFCYHGTSELVLALSTDSYPPEDRPDWLVTFDVPDPYRGVLDATGRDAAEIYLEAARRKLDRLEARGVRLAAALIDCSFDNIGVVRPPEGFMAGLFSEIRRRGGLLIADEVQAGYCRMGTHWWGFQHHGMQPDIVTCSKPMGDGHPISVMVTTRDLATRFARDYSYFNTTAGNPVSGAVGRVVLDIFERDRLLDRATDTGHHLSAGLADLTARHAVVGTARGYGMFQGLDLVTDPVAKTPVSARAARHLTTLAMQEGVLTGTSGVHGNVLKIRPPLIAERAHVDIACAALDRALTRFAETL